jgi:hypothetical protein
VTRDDGDDDVSPLGSLVRVVRGADRIRTGLTTWRAAADAYERCAQIAEQLGDVDCANAIRREAAALRPRARV